MASKTPEEMAIRYSDLRGFADRRLDYKAKMLLEQGFLAGYQAAKNEEATKDQKIAELWAESIKNMLPSVHEITLFPSKLKEDK